MKVTRGFGALLVLVLLTVLLAPGAAAAAALPPRDAAPAAVYQGTPPEPPPNDALRRPPEVEKRIQTARAAAAADEFRAMAAAPAAPPPSNKPGDYDTSAFMIGRVAVGIVLVESTDTSEDWDLGGAGRRDQVVSKIQEGLNFWTSQPKAPASLSFVYDIHRDDTTNDTTVSLGYDPIERTAMGYQGQWISAVMNNMGYGGANYFEQVYAYNNDLRHTYDTDWAYTIFVVDSYFDSDGRFYPEANGYAYFGYAYLGGPFVVMTYDNNGWGIDRMHNVAAHETAHIFMAADQYAPCSANEYYGYLAVQNTNCMGTPTLMRTGDTDDGLDSTVMGQIGWRDTAPLDGVYDPVDHPSGTPVSVVFESMPPDATPLLALSYAGYARELPWPHGICVVWGWCEENDMTILDIASIDYRVDGGGWIPAVITDGSLDSDSEGFSFTTGTLSPGPRTVEVRATDSNTPASETIRVHNLTILGPLPEGKYDDDVLNIVYDGSWARTTPAGTWQTSLHTSSAPGSYAEVRFTGQRVRAFYTAGNYHLVDVLIDGAPAGAINQYGSPAKTQQVWNSPGLPAGEHVVRFVHAGPAGSSVNLDAVEVLAYADITPPGPVADLAAVPGAAGGSVALGWSAPGDDTDSGTASAYLIRYASDPIVTGDDWDAAVPVVHNLVPKAYGTPESFTVTGLYPGLGYHFALRAVDEEGNTGAISNSAASTAGVPAPVTEAIYDNRHRSIVYSGAWTSIRNAGAYGSTYLIGSAPRIHAAPGYAQLTFEGTRVGLTYLTGPSFLKMDVLIDGVKVATLDQRSPRWVYRRFWLSDRLSDGTHTVRFVPTGKSNVDAIRVYGVADETPPAAILLAAAPGATDGSVALSWPAPGDDGGSGRAVSYQVRYAAAPITDLTWADASLVSTGIPVPADAGTPQSMTVKGLLPGAIYHFAILAVDDEFNEGALSNSASTATKAPPAVSPGTYDDNRTSVFRYKGKWKASRQRGPYLSTLHVSSTGGSYAQVTFDGRRFSVVYASGPTYGTLKILVDGTQVGVIDQYSLVKRNQQVWTGPILDAGVHTVHMLHATGKTVNVDAIQIAAEPDTTAPASIADLAAAPGAAEASVALTFSAPGDDDLTGTAHSYLVRYATSVINDETAWDAATPFAGAIPAPEVAGSEQTITVTGLLPGVSYYFAVRAVDEEDNRGGLSNSPSSLPSDPTPMDPGYYDDRHTAWRFTGTWQLYNGSGPYQNTLHISQLPGSYADFTFNGTQFVLRYATGLRNGSMEIYVDGNLVHTIDTYSATTLYQQTWTSAVLPLAVHHVRIVHIGPITRKIAIDSIQTHTAGAGSPPTLAGCPVFPADNFWNTRVDGLPVHSLSSQWIDSIGRATGFHMDFGSGTWDGGPIGIPFNIVDNTVTKVPVSFYYPLESDPGPYPIPASPLREFGSDHHILILERSTCTLYEIYAAEKVGSAWYGGSGAIWDLNAHALRPAGWTSADAAGLPILPGLVRYDEIEAGRITHALRFTASQTNRYIWPARHLTSDNETPGIPPMGARFRLKSSYDISGFPADMQVLLRAMQEYGILLADNGSDWYVSGAPDERWDNDMLHLLDVLTGDDFEAVDTAGLIVDPDSGAAASPSIWRPAVGATWQWQLDGAIDTSVAAAVYDLDLFDTPASTVAALHAGGRRVVCYISAGSWEDWRPDAGAFPAGVLGDDYEGWPGEKWLDIRQIDTLAPIMRARLDLCKQKGFDAVEPDNIDAYTNTTGFPLTAQDQLNYNIWLANEAHARGLSIGLKNDSDQVAALLPYFDWALTEDCFDQGWCADMSPFIAAGKPVFAAEYTDTGISLGDFCPQAAALQFSAILKHRDLDAYRQACP